MNNENLKLIIELAKENPNIDTDKLLQLSGMAEKEVKPIKEVAPTKEVQKSPRRIKKLGGNRGKNWTNEEDNDLLVLYDMGLTHREIAERMNRTEASINSRISRLRGAKGYIPKGKNQGKPYRRGEIEYLKRIIEEHDFQISNISKGLKEEIAETLERTVEAITTQLYAINNEL